MFVGSGSVKVQVPCPFRVPANYGRLMDRSPMPKSPVARALTAAALLLPVAAGSSPALSETRAPIFTADRDACYGRVYDQAHLKAHPRQKVTSVHVMRSLERRREAENWTPDARAEAIRMLREDGLTSVDRVRQLPRPQGHLLTTRSPASRRDRSDGVRCMIECDGGSYAPCPLRVRNSVLLHNNGFVLVGGCGEEMPRRARRLHFSPGRRRQGVPARQRSRSRPAAPRSNGPPRSRPACRCASDSRRTSSSASGAITTPPISQGNPKQLMSQIRVGRLVPGKERDDDTPSKWWWFNVKLDVSITLRSNLADHHRALCLHGEGSELGVLPHRRG